MSALDGWIDVFRTGTHTDSSGKTRTWTEQDLDGIVAAHAAGDAPPVVIGHPRDNDPAWGWVERARRTGDRLQVRLRDVHTAFREAVEAGRYRGRSISLARTEDGAFRIRHLGFLGGVAPAVDGLSPTQFAAPPEVTYEFASGAESDGVERADATLPQHEIDGLPTRDDLTEPDNHETAAAAPAFSAGAAATRGGATSPATDPGPGADGSGSPQGEHAMTEAEIAQQRQQLDQRDDDLAKREARFASQERLREMQAEVDKHVDAGRILPAEAAAMAAFMAQLPEEEFTFAAADGGEEATVAPRTYFSEFLSHLPKRVDYRERSRADTRPAPLDKDDSDAVARKAHAFMAQQAELGIVLTPAQAVDAVREGRAD